MCSVLLGRTWECAAFRVVLWVQFGKWVCRSKQLCGWTLSQTALAVVMLLPMMITGGAVLLGWEVLIAACCTHVLVPYHALATTFAICWLRAALLVSSGHTSKPVAVSCPDCAGQQLFEVYLHHVRHALASSFAGLHWWCQAATRASLLQAAQIMLVSKYHVYLDVSVSSTAQSGCFAHKLRVWVLQLHMVWLLLTELNGTIVWGAVTPVTAPCDCTCSSPQAV